MDWRITTTTMTDGMGVTWVKVAGDPKAFARINNEAGAMHVTDIFKDGQAAGAGTEILTQGVRAAGGLRSGQTLVFEGIIN